MKLPLISNRRSITGRVALGIAALVATAAFAAIAIPTWLRPEIPPWAHPAPGPPDECDPPAAPDVPAGKGYFTDITDESGIDFRHVVGPLGTYFMPESVGAGGGLFDYDNDGDLDLLLINAGRSPKATGEFPPGTKLGNRLFRQDGDGRFSDVTSESGLGVSDYGMGCAIGDIDNDNDLDVFQTNYGADRLFQNNGDGTFADITAACGINEDDWGTGAVFFDYDRDGRLDLFVVNYTHDPMYGHSIACGFYLGRVSYCGPLKFQPTIDRLFHNEGISSEGTIRFKDVTEAAGMTAGPTWGFAASAADFNRDGWPDLYVANDAGMNRLWINQRDGTFREEGGLRGCAYNEQGTPEGSMGLALGDIEGDGDFDLVVSNLATEGASVFRHEGEGTFSENSRAAAIAPVTRPHTGWGAALIDLDHDGDLDLPLVHGRVVPCERGFAPHGEETFVECNDEVTDADAYWREYSDLNLLLFNQGDGRFEDRTKLGGDFTAAIGSGRAMIYGDIDNDGDLDLVVTNCGGRARLYRNDVPKLGNWLQVRLVDAVGQIQAYGAEVSVLAGDRRLCRVMNPADSYLASNDPRLHFGLGSVEQFDSITVRWPDGSQETFPSGAVNRLMVLNRGKGSSVPCPTSEQLQTRSCSSFLQRPRE